MSRPMAFDISTNIDSLQTQVDFNRYNLCPNTTPLRKPSVLLQLLKNQAKKQDRLISLLYLSSQKPKSLPRPDSAPKLRSSPPVSSPPNLFSFNNQLQPLPKIQNGRFATPIRLNTKNLSTLSRRREKKIKKFENLNPLRLSPICLKKIMINCGANQ